MNLPARVADPGGKNGHVSKGLIVREVMPDIGAVARSLLAVLLVAAAALWWGSTGTATAAAGAAAIAGAVALHDSARGRLPVVAVVSLVSGAAVLLGALASEHDVVFVVVVGLWCFAAGMAWALSANAGLIAVAAAALLVTVPPITQSPTAVAISIALILGGGLAQSVLIAVWPQRRSRVQRDASTRAYRSLSADAARLASDSDRYLDPEPLIALREAFTLTEARARRRSPDHRGTYGLPERIAATLAELAGDRNDAVSAVLLAAGAVLDAIADRGLSSRRDADYALRRFDVHVASVDGPQTAVAQRLSVRLHEAAALRFGDSSPALLESLRRPGVVVSLRSTLARVRRHLEWTSPVLRHALRLAVAAALGITLARFAGVEHGYWIPLTVLLVLRPETAHTYTRCSGRIAGTAAGIVVASAVTMLWHPTGMVAAVIAVAFLAVTYVVAGLNFVALSAALAAAIVFLIDIDGVADTATLAQRLLAIAVGGMLAVLAHVALPDHALIRLRQRAGELLKTEIDYAATVIKAYAHQLDHPADALAAAWLRALRARAAFEAASGATRMTSRELRRWLRSYRTALNAVTSACTTLEGSLPARPADTLSREFVAAVDDYVDALRGAPPNPAKPWTLDIVALTAADQQMRSAAAQLTSTDSAARVLVAEVATITRHLSGIAADPAVPAR